VTPALALAKIILKAIADSPPKKEAAVMVTEEKSQVIKSYAVCCVQAYMENFNPDIRGRFWGDDLKKRNLDMMCDYIDAIFFHQASPVKLVCFPEFGIGGMYARTTTVEEVKKYEAITIPGPETDILAAKARQYGIYIAACNHENDPLLPDNFVNTAFIINPKGKIILKYRKLDTQFGCDPHDIYDKYVNPVTGTREFFPVVDTEIGRLACFICADIGTPEIPRIFALKGAEVLMHLNGGSVGEMDYMKLRVRAADNTIYVIEENWAGSILASDKAGDRWIPTRINTKNGGQNMIIGYNGNIIAEARGSSPQLVTGNIDIMALRENRRMWRQPILNKGNYVAKLRTELYAPYYNKTIFPPNRVLTEGPMKMAHDESVTRRRMEAVQNVINGYDFYSEDDVK